MDNKTWIPKGIPTDKPTSARMYDYLLGGYHNFKVDRQAAERLLKERPDVRTNARAARAFLRRVVLFLSKQGIDQFLDIGSGIPTVGNVHELAQQANPAARIVYVDIDPVAVAHSTALLVNNPLASAISGDVEQPDQILHHPTVKTLLDFRRPVAVLLLSVLHFALDNKEACRAIGYLRDAQSAGSYLAVLHPTFDGRSCETIETTQEQADRSGFRARYRTYAEVQQLFEGYELVEPGLVRAPVWRPEGTDDLLVDEPDKMPGWAGVGRKP